MTDKKLSGGFWRRFGAGLVDFLLFLVVFHAVMLAVYPATGGHVRAASNFLHFGTQCFGSMEQTAQGPAHRQICIYSTFGLEYDRELTHKVQGGDEVTAAAGADDNPIRAFDLGALKGVLFIALLAVLEAGLGTTPGKALFGLRVQRMDEERAAFVQTFRRNGLIWMGWALLYPINALEGRVADAIVYGGFGLALVLWIIPLIALILARPEPYYDAWTGTRVTGKA